MQKVKFKQYYEDGTEHTEIGSLIHIDRETTVLDYDDVKVPVDRIVFLILGPKGLIYRVDPDDVKYIDINY